MNSPIALLTDFGLRDGYVGAMKGAILARNPAAVLVDLCHEVPAQDVRRGAFLLAANVSVFPAGSIFVAVVDPGVGTERKGVALEAGDYRFVGPDNGLLSWALRFLARNTAVVIEARGNQLALIAGVRAVELTEARFWRPEVRSTFHGRDVFGPVAAELSLGRSLDELGRPLGQLVGLPWPEPHRLLQGLLRGEVLTVDGFGNLVTNLWPSDLPEEFELRIGGWSARGPAPHFQLDAELVALVGSSGLIEIAAPNGSAWTLTEAKVGTPVDARST